MPQKNLIKLKCESCKKINYWTTKNLKKVEKKLALKKFCKWCRKQTAHKESKK